MSTWKERRIESAAMDVHCARDARGLMINLCNPLSVDSVKKAIVSLGQCFEPGSTFFDPNGEYTAAQNLRKLAVLLEAHLS